MPTLSAGAVALALAALVAGVLVGWLLRGLRTAREKAALSAGWQHQLDAQQTENDRIAAQNTSLMEQVSQFQATTGDLRKRAEALAKEARGAAEARGELERALREARANLDSAVRQRDRLRASMAGEAQRAEAFTSQLRSRDERIARLRTELGRWQERVPPLLARYRERDEEARTLERDLAAARDRIADLEQRARNGTRIEPVGDAQIGDLDASNDQYEDTLSIESVDASPVPGDRRDDLQKIRGIGPAIEKTLHGLGILSLRQIAELTDRDVDRIAGEIRGFRSRLEREDWVGQARELLGDRSTDPA